MKDIKLLYESMLNEHRKIQNEIADMKANSYELSLEEKDKVRTLEQRQVQLMNQMRVLFNNKNGR